MTPVGSFSRTTVRFSSVYQDILHVRCDVACLNATVSTEVEFGVCTVTCGKIGLREVLLTSGCPGTEAKCIVHVEECQGPVDCGCKWGIPVSEGLACVKMPCIYIPPENRFKCVWKMFIPNKTAHILPNDSAIMKVCRDTHSVTFQCGTQENGNTIASVKYRVYAKNKCKWKKIRRIETGQSRRTTTDAILVFCLVTGIMVTIGVILAMTFMILHWAVVKSFVNQNLGKKTNTRRPTKDHYVTWNKEPSWSGAALAFQGFGASTCSYSVLTICMGHDTRSVRALTHRG
ncbi:sperm acrosome membrane-associated protein 1 [Athene noctua]|uniref:sperm acrosome membrane-associated protein 1 n=1 Tax=Athene noctua TaxID=126797 RepID=UPI003EC102E0